MDRFFNHIIQKVFFYVLFILSTSSYAIQPSLPLQKQPGFFRFTLEDIKMPQNISNTGLLGIGYFADFTPNLYGGIEGFGSIAGTQGGLFILGFGGGYHHPLIRNWWGDVGMFVGGGGGRSSLVGGGLMLRPYVGLAYDWNGTKIGLHYSYVTFPSGEIHSSQLGLALDIPFDFYYVSPRNYTADSYNYQSILLPLAKWLAFQRNDFGLVLQAYRQSSGTRNVNNVIQDGTISLIGAELDHYMTQNSFWYIKTSGAFSGIPNGYMDILGGLGYHYTTPFGNLALVPQMGVGAGGGGNVDTGGGVIIQPQLGVEWPIGPNFATRFSGGYLWAPSGKLKALTATVGIFYHLDIATVGTQLLNSAQSYVIQDWRVQLFNQTYVRPQRAHMSARSPINLIGVQIDQLLSPTFFLSYQGAFAYSGFHAGGYATGMVGAGVQTLKRDNDRLQLYTSILIGAGGGGDLALAGGAIVEPVIGLNIALTEVLGLQMSVSDIKALHHNLNTLAFNVGLNVNFGTLNKCN